MSLERKEIFEFGEFRLDVEEHTIERIDGHKNGALTEKAFQALVLLVRRRGHLVLKDEMIRFVWPDTIVEDNNLEKCIHQLRHFLGETSNGSTYIETVRKHGYRFVRDVRAVGVSGTWLPETFRTDNGKNGSAGTNGHQRTEPQAESDEIDGTGSPSLPVGKARYRGKTVALALFATLLAVALAGYMLLGPSTPTVADKGKISLAVLPGKPMDPSNRDNRYEVGIADAIINSLSQVQGFEVRSLNAVLDYNSVKQDPVIAGREQKVDYVLAPNYQLAGGRIRITASLINVASGKVEHALKFEEEATSYFAVQDAVAASFGSDLMRRFATTLIGPAAKRGTSNEEAYRLYLQGAALADKYTPKDVPKAIEYFEQAVRLDPNYALAYARLANAQTAVVGNRSGSADAQYPKAKAAIEKALAIDDNLSEAHSYLGEVKANFEGDFAGAEREHKRAIELNPNSSIAHRMYSLLLSHLGRQDESIAEGKTAIDLEPASVMNHLILGRSLLFARRYDEAITELERTAEMDPEYFFAHQSLSAAHRFKGDYDRAFESLVKSRILVGEKPDEIDLWKAIYAKSGWRAILERQLEQATENEKNGKPNYNQLANLSSELGHRDETFAYLEKALTRYGSITMLKVNPHFDSLRDDPRFEELLKRTGLK